MLILRRLPRMSVLFARRLITWSEFKLGLTRIEIQAVFLRKGGIAFVDREMNKAFFGC